MRQIKTDQNNKSGQEVAKQSGQASCTRFHVDFWKNRLYQKTFTRNGKTYKINEYSVRLQHLGRRESFAIGTINAQAGAIKAKEIAGYLESNGWELTLAKYKPDQVANEKICSLGEFLANVRQSSHLKLMTVRRYEVKLRRIVADLAGVDDEAKGKAKRAKYDYVNGGQKEWAAKVDAQNLSILTPESINRWRNEYIARSNTDPIVRKSAERSAVSYLRNAKALFSKDILATLNVKLPPNPFNGVRLKDPGSPRYHSEIDPVWLINCAESELKYKLPQLYLALSLCLWGGLRRREADLLTWAQLDFENGQIHIRRTIYFEPKTEESQRDIDLPIEAVSILREFREGSVSEFVLEGSEPRLNATYDYYRADNTWRALNAWLRNKGVTQYKAIHMLRKESGSIMASQFGIEAARQHLGHRDIGTTSSHYISKKVRREVNLTGDKSFIKMIDKVI